MMTEQVWQYFNSDLFILVIRGDLVDAYANDYLIDIMESDALELKDVLFMSECLGEL